MLSDILRVIIDTESFCDENGKNHTYEYFFLKKHITSEYFYFFIE